VSISGAVLSDFVIALLMEFSDVVPPQISVAFLLKVLIDAELSQVFVKNVLSSGIHVVLLIDCTVVSFSKTVSLIDSSVAIFTSPESEMGSH